MSIAYDSVLQWLRETDSKTLDGLWHAADEKRKEWVGDAIHLRGLIECSSVCIRSCTYCGLAKENKELTRYRMTSKEMIECAHRAVDLGYGTVVLQGGEDYGLTKDMISETIRAIKSETKLAVTLSLGERTDEELVAWREAGADRYLLRFETSRQDLYEKIHPNVLGKVSDRMAILRRLKELGYEVGTGIMLGIPGQTYEDVAKDIVLFSEMDVDMIGMGPYLAHEDTPLGEEAEDICAETEDQCPSGELITYKAVALARLLCPWANIPATTALATINKVDGRELALSRGANIVMPNVTPVKYRALYEIYPDKACIEETAEQCQGCLDARIRNIHRHIGIGPGHAQKRA